MCLRMLNLIHQRMSVGARLGLIAAVLLIPIAMFAGLFIAQSMKEIHFAEREMAGADYIQAVWSQFEQNDPATAGEVAAARAKFDPLLGTASAADTFLNENDPTARRLAARAFFITVADASNLTLDPDLDSYYVMDLTVVRLPALHHAMTALAQASPADIAGMAVALDRVQEASGAVHSSISNAIAGNPDGGTARALKDDGDALQAAVEASLAQARAGQPIDDRTFDIPADALWENALRELDRLLADRISSLQSNLTTWLAASSLVLLLAGFLILIISKAMAGRIQALVSSMNELAADDPHVEIPCQEDRNETGQIAAALLLFKASLIERLRLQAETAVMHEQTAEKLREMERQHEAATQELVHVVAYVKQGLTKLYEGDLGFRLEKFFPVDFKSIRMDYNQALNELEGVMRHILASADNIRATAMSIAAGADNLQQRTEQQAAGVEEAAAALEQITATVKSNASNAIKVRAVATAAGQDAAASSAILTDTRTAMSKIERSSSEVARILGVIDEIAFQTNLLALNAGVEAARAGDAGRGFAVVATEVRALAQRSADAAKEINALISASAGDVSTGVGLVSKTAEALERIAGRIGEINALVAGLATSAEEEARGVAEVNQAVTQMDRITQQNAAMVEESAAASHTLASDASALAKMVQKFKVSDVKPAKNAPIRLAAG